MNAGNWLLRSIGLAASVAVLAAPRPADACGGTFCDAWTNMPVDQSGETVLFSLDEGEVEVHVQFTYTGDPERFAWLIPVPEVPTFEVGSQPLFDALLEGSAPQWSVDTDVEDCGEEESPPEDDSDSMGCGMSFGSGWAPPPGSGADDPTREPDPDPNVTTQLVGSFEVQVLQPSDAAELDAWLEVNDFAADEQADPIFEEYLAEGHAFVAVKLRPGAGIDELHPIVIRYPGDEPCVPLRLTRIAATDDMPVRVFFLGQQPALPINYRTVELNPLQLDWLNGASNYETALTLAIDEAEGGRGFVVEYAGDPGVVDATALTGASWQAERFGSMPMDSAADLEALVDELRRQELLDCNTSRCSFEHPLIERILGEFVPPPAGVQSGQFYACPSCWIPSADEAQWAQAWDAEAFSAMLWRDIVVPGEHAERLLQRAGTLTRLYTRISPQEMTQDPIFEPLAPGNELEPIDGQYVAHRFRRCDGVDVITLPDGREVVTDGGWPGFSDMPFAHRITLAVPTGAPIVERDDTETIDALLVESNQDILTRSGASTDAVSTDWGGTAEESDGGCGGCEVSRRRLGDGPLWLGLLWGFAWWQRRNRTVAA